MFQGGVSEASENRVRKIISANLVGSHGRPMDAAK